MFIRPVRIFSVVLAVFCSARFSSSAAVYMRLSGGRAAAARLETLGAAKIAVYPMRVNGMDAEVSLFGFDRPHAFVRPDVLRAFGVDPSASANRRAGLLRFERDGRRFILMMPALNPERAMAILVELAPDPAAMEAPAYPGPAWPAAPSETLRFSAVNRRSGFAFTLAESPAGAETVRRGVARQLSENGWSPLDEKLATLPAGGWYGRGASICYILILPSDAGGVRLAVLRRDKTAWNP